MPLLFKLLLFYVQGDCKPPLACFEAPGKHIDNGILCLLFHPRHDAPPCVAQRHRCAPAFILESGRRKARSLSSSFAPPGGMPARARPGDARSGAGKLVRRHARGHAPRPVAGDPSKYARAQVANCGPRRRRAANFFLAIFALGRFLLPPAALGVRFVVRQAGR